MAAATGTLEGQDSFFNQQAGPQQALQLEALQQARVGGSLDSQVLGTSGFDTKAALEQLQASHSGAFSPLTSASGGNAGSAFDGGSAFGAVSSVFGAASTLSPHRRRGDFSGTNPVHGRHSADPTLAFAHERSTSLGGFGAPTRAASSDLAHIGSIRSPLHESLDTSGDGGLNRTVGSPTTHSGIASPQLRSVASPPHESQDHLQLQQQQFGQLDSGGNAGTLLQQNGGGSGGEPGGTPGPLESCKLVILGLPWDTTEETLETYFSQFGPLQEAVIMKDRYTGKSRGFGFVSYQYVEDASRVISTEHQIDGRRCEAKLALPRGGGNPSRTTRIFVARILPGVTDQAFREYFEQFGVVQDAYMPKDASKLGHRGIGFVTFASPDTVEQVVAAAPHILLGQELAIDRATPKDRAPAAAYPALAPAAAMNGAPQMAFPYGAAANSYALAAGLGMTPAALSAAAGSAALRASDPHQLAALLAAGQEVGGLNGFPGLNAAGSSNNMQVMGIQGMVGGPGDLGMPLGLPPQQHGYAPAHSASRRPPAADLAGRGQSPSLSGGNSGGRSYGGNGGPAGNAGGSVTSGLDAHAGPRIFVGKLNRATTEADVREYFTRFGYVMDVYMPRDKHNRHEHRGFGFVTFETEAAVQRVGAHGVHHIRGVAVAIDSAVPRREEGGVGAPPMGGGGYPQVAPGDMSFPGLAAAMNVIDLARGDAGPLRHPHAAAAQGRYRPYGHQPDMMPGNY
mmetsp:Transcript_5980/g.17107  ORF Transcript_5980/g.17107 Transcript_5980/m.17107 type:complete len:738 (-) Transcript_5980:1411-3624(-)